MNEAINTTKVVLHNVKVLRCASDLVNTALVSEQKFMVIASGSRPDPKTEWEARIHLFLLFHEDYRQPLLA